MNFKNQTHPTNNLIHQSLTNLAKGLQPLKPVDLSLPQQSSNIKNNPPLQKSNEEMELEVLKVVQQFLTEKNIFKDNKEILGLLNEFERFLDNIKTEKNDKETKYENYKSLKEVI